MKLGQVLLLNLATVTVALVVYDQLRDEEARPAAERSSTRARAPDYDEMELRLAALEVRRRSSRKTAPDAAILERLAAIEASLNGDAAPAKYPSADKRLDTPAASKVPAEGTSAEEIRDFRRLREAVRREDTVKKNKERVESALNQLSINLTSAQRTKIHFAHAAFEPQITRIWGEVKMQARETIASGGEVDRQEIMTSTQARIQQEFAATVIGSSTTRPTPKRSPPP